MTVGMDLVCSYVGGWLCRLFWQIVVVFLTEFTPSYSLTHNGDYAPQNSIPLFGIHQLDSCYA